MTYQTSPLEELARVRRGRLRRLKEVPVLPSLVTLGNLFFGFLAMSKVADALRQATPGQGFTAALPGFEDQGGLAGAFELAVILVFVAMVFDALDGRVARMTGQTTAFGAQLDSLADMVTFGVVPAFLAKQLIDWHAQSDVNNLLPVHPKLFYAAAAVYVAGAALRLARFNVETGADEEDHRQFKGLPSPAAAAVVCALVAMFCTRDHDSAAIGHWLLGTDGYDLIVRAMPGVVALLGLLMISNVPYPHAVYALVKGRHSMPFLGGLVVLIIIAALEWQLALAACTIGYVLWGMALGLWRAMFRRGSDDGDDDAEPTPRAAPSRN